MEIGFFDTGLGGATILKNIYNDLNAEYIYLADNENAPYGTKGFEEVRYLTENCIKKLIDMDCRIIVIACNTATSAGIEYLRDKYKEVTFIGTEPAIKPAIENAKDKKVILSATTLTLKGEKLNNLLDKLNSKEKVYLLALDELVKFADVEANINSLEAYKYIKEKLKYLNLNEYSSIVLGCTHFPIFKDEFRKILPDNMEIIDSSNGVYNILKEKLIDCSSKEKSLELIQTKYSESFEEKFYKIIKE